MRLSRCAVVLFVVAVLLIGLITIATTAPNPGITINFELYEHSNGSITKSWVLSRDDVYAAVFVRAITPRGPGEGGVPRHD